MIHLPDFDIHEHSQQYLPICIFSSSATHSSFDHLQLKQIRDVEHSHLRRDSFFDQIGLNSHLESEPSLLQSPTEDPSFIQERDSQHHQIIRKTEMITKMKNETKNIPKNFGKGIISFVQNNQAKLRSLIISEGLNYNTFLNYLKTEKRSINTIADLRSLWTNPQTGKCLRKISNLFFRKYALKYIFNSRISSYSSHIKYRQSLWQALRSPQSFNRIKQY